jgi:thiazole synthase
MALEDPFVLAGKTYRSRLIVGSGKYRSFEETRRATEAAAPRSSPWPSAA